MIPEFNKFKHASTTRAACFPLLQSLNRLISVLGSLAAVISRLTTIVETNYRVSHPALRKLTTPSLWRTHRDRKGTLLV